MNNGWLAFKLNMNYTYVGVCVYMDDTPIQFNRVGSGMQNG
jgi:hypothetical protein